MLPNGTLLITGGESIDPTNGNATLAGAELYNATSNSWTAVTAMNGARYAHTATLIGTGSVVVTGGLFGNSYLMSAEAYW